MSDLIHDAQDEAERQYPTHNITEWQQRQAAYVRGAQFGAAWQAAQPRTVSTEWLMEAWWAASREGWAVPQSLVEAFARQLGFTVAEAGEDR